MTIELTTDPDLHLLVDGQRIAPELRGNLAVFALALPAQDIQLCSRAARPSQIGLGDDDRLLGYALLQVAVESATGRVAIPARDPAFYDGFLEAEDTGVRWMTGAAHLPPALFHGITGPAEMIVRGFGLPSYPLHDLAAAADARLMDQFESLGDNCEFGLVQRHFHIEPISMMRWVSTDRERLLAGLHSRFKGFGDPAHATLEWKDEPPEYKLRDARFMSSHTWVQTRLEDPAAEERLRTTGCARLRLLRRKLLDDIKRARRIFVFKSNHGTDEATLRAIHAALRTIGPAAMLLGVRHAATPAEVGQVTALGDGLFIGAIDTFSAATPSYATWRQLCAETARLAGSPE